MNTKILQVFVAIVVVLVAEAYADECVTGAVKQEDCNTCRCLNGNWACTRQACLTKRAAECSTGETKRDDCNTCFCANGNWACTLKACLRKRDIPARFRTQRQRRDMHVAADLLTTPCAPNDYFHVDCNVCYCNLEHTGYLCTSNHCNQPDEALIRSGQNSEFFPSTGESAGLSTGSTWTVPVPNINQSSPTDHIVNRNVTLPD